MSDIQSYLIFTLNNARYGVETQSVQEIFFLPALSAIQEAPPDIVGLIDLRGEILPVMALELRLGYGLGEYGIADSIIVLESEGDKVGLIVNQVHEVQAIAAAEIVTELSYGRQATPQSHRLVRGVAKTGGELVAILDCQRLIHSGESVQPLIDEVLDDNGQLPQSSLILEEAPRGRKNRCLYPHASEEELAILRDRAENLKTRTEGEDLAGLMPIAVVGLNGEYFGLDLNLVREFTDIDKIVPIPCCPSYILGNLNLRGEIVTLVDLRHLLNLPLTDLGSHLKAMVVHLEDLVVGVAIEQVCDVTYVHSSQVMPVPAAIHSSKDEYLRGTVAYRDRMMSLLDLAKILTDGCLVVDEEP